MHSIGVLPDIKLQAGNTITEKFIRQGLSTFHEACQWVQALPYGANSRSDDSLILFEEGYGNCTTKHGAIARLAKIHGLPVHKNLGFYRLNDEIVTGVNAIIHPHGLTFIPQIHCFLSYAEYRVDLTEGNCNGKNKTIEDYDFVVQVQPDLNSEDKRAYYREYLQYYYLLAPELATLGEDKVFELLEACDRQVGYRCSIMVDALAMTSR